MAFTFPMPLTDFFEGLPITELSFDLSEALEMAETGGGEVTTADIGERLWRASLTLRPMYYAEAERIKARLNLMRYAGRSLLAHSLPVIYPADDPTGSKLGASTPKIVNVAANNRDLRIGGLPVGYRLSTGDFLSFTYGANPTRYALHQVSGTNAVAQASGECTVEVTPFIQPGWAINAPIRLIKPQFKAIVRPGSTNAGRSGQQWTNGIALEIIQTFR